MSVRNFWVEGQIDGRASDLSGAPRAKDGGMSLKIYQRDNGASVEVVDIRCYAIGDVLHTCVYGKDGTCLADVTTGR